MTLQPGQSLAHYRIVEKIGAGGMGEVWVAEDTRLRRRIALKVLPSWTAGDPHLRARFEREAQAVAALNHPNIVTIHSVEEADGVLFLTMELVEGEPLSRRMRAAMPLEQIFALSIPLADAVGAAHDRGILHRDLKPDNVMVTDRGLVKVLDFGLARLREQAAEQPAGPGSTDALTREGRIVGTAAYMSPEQAEAKPVGPEADVFALGIVLYQMATGERPFHGATPISLISSILKDEPPAVTERNRALPPHLGWIVRRCLAKDPARRYPTARELRNELEFLREELARSGADAGVRRRPRLLIAAALLLVAVAGAAGWLRPRPEPRGRIAAVSQQTFATGIETDPSLSPDGQFLAYAARTERGDTDVFLLRVEGQNEINLTEDSPADDGAPAFSPDGARIAFRSERDGGGIYVMGATGEAVRRVTDRGFDPAWSPDGARIAFATEPVDQPLTRWSVSELWWAEVETGEPHRLHSGDAVQPSWSPGGGRIAFWTSHATDAALSGQRDVGTIGADGSGVVLATLDQPLDWRPVWSPDGRHLYFASDRGGSMNLWRLRIEEASGRPAGEPEPVTAPSLWAGPFAIGAGGARIAYVARDDRGSLYAVAFDPQAGRIHGEPQAIAQGALLPFSWEVSPDGAWIALTNTGRQEDIYLLHPDGGGRRRLTDDLHKDRGVSWLDADRLIFYSNRGGGYEIWEVRRDGGDLRALTETAGQPLWSPRVSPDGSRLMAHNDEGTYLFDLGGEGPLRKEQALHLGSVAGAEGTFRGFHWSPDGGRILGTVATVRTATASIHDTRASTFRIFQAPVEGMVSVGDFLPDGRRFLAAAGGTAWVVDSESGAWVDLALRIDGRTLRLSPDGTTLHYARTETEADVWVAELR
jgi:Tol biopolymer transport system component